MSWVELLAFTRRVYILWMLWILISLVAAAFLLAIFWKAFLGRFFEWLIVDFFFPNSSTISTLGSDVEGLLGSLIFRQSDTPQLKIARIGTHLQMLDEKRWKVNAITNAGVVWLFIALIAIISGILSVSSWGLNGWGVFWLVVGTALIVLTFRRMVEAATLKYKLVQKENAFHALKDSLGSKV